MSHFKVEKYNHSYHMQFSAQLIAARLMKNSFLHDLPENGYIAFENEKVVAMGFLRLVEGSYGMFDGFISDPVHLSKIRHEGLDKIVEALILRAKELELRNIFAFIKDEGLKSRAISHGFISSEFSLMGLSLSQEIQQCHF